MFISTTDYIPGTNYHVLGLVQGNIVTSRHIGRDLMAGVKAMVGGEIKTFTEMTSGARQEAENRMAAQAQAMGADAVIGVRFAGEVVAEGTIEMLAYGTAIKFVQ